MCLCFFFFFVITTHGGVCVCVCVCVPVRGWQLALSSPCHTQKRLWLLECDRPLARLYTPPFLHPCSLAGPATLLVAHSLFRSALHMGLVSHGNLLSPIRSSRQLGFPSILPSLFSGPATSHSVPLQRLHAPASHNQSLSHAHNHAKLMGTLSLALGWKQRFVTRLLGVDSMHARPRFCSYTYQDRQGPQSPQPDAVFCLRPHQLVWTKWL